jgi:hypothetical protein
MAPPVKNASGIDHHAWRVNFTRDHAFCFDLDASLCENHAIEAPRNHHAIALDLSFNFGSFA